MTEPSVLVRVHLAPAAARHVRGGHPWVFADSVREESRIGQAGDVAALYDSHDRFLGLGLYDPESPLRVRVLHRGPPVALDEAWWQRHLDTALQRRRRLFDAQTTGYRWIHGENDGWPGLVLDRYANTLVLKLYTAAWLPHLDSVVSRLLGTLAPQRLVLRLSRNIQQTTRARLQLDDGAILSGPAPDQAVPFLENGLQFEADVVRGQKTGFFLDQRENRRRVQDLASGQAVLNLFSYNGGFSLYAALGGAVEATDLDISAHALAGARRHFALNQHRPTVAQCRHETIQADAFEWLQVPSSRRFGLIVLDPPSLAKRASERAGAQSAYRRLAGSALRRLARPGVLVAASCSAHVTAEDFFGIIREVATADGGRWEVLGTFEHPADHPATFPEAHYLKCILVRMLSAPSRR